MPFYLGKNGLWHELKRLTLCRFEHHFGGRSNLVEKSIGAFQCQNVGTWNLNRGCRWIDLINVWLRSNDANFQITFAIDWCLARSKQHQSTSKFVFQSLFIRISNKKRPKDYFFIDDQSHAGRILNRKSSCLTLRKTHPRRSEIMAKKKATKKKATKKTATKKKATRKKASKK
jgi:hypothetical protein